MHAVCFVCRHEFDAAAHQCQRECRLPLAFHHDFCPTCRKTLLEDFEQQFRFRRIRVEPEKNGG
jgi:hypothetical protein